MAVFGRGKELDLIKKYIYINKYIFHIMILLIQDVCISTLEKTDGVNKNVQSTDGVNKNVQSTDGVSKNVQSTDEGNNGHKTQNEDNQNKKHNE